MLNAVQSRILLISINTCTAPDPVFPLGMSYVAAALRRAGHDVRVFDMLASAEPVTAILQATRPHFVGISLRNIDDVLIRKRQTFFGSLPELCSTIRAQCSAKIVIGGSGFSIFPQQLLSLSTADYGIHGAGEDSLNALIAALEGGVDVKAIPGLVYRADGRVVCNPAAGTTPKLEATDYNLDGMASFYLQHTGLLNVQTQRGCSHHCCYCTYPVIEGAGHRPRTAEYVADEFEQAVRAGAKYVFVVDSTFNSSDSHVRAICEAIIRRGIKMRWGCFLRPQGLTADLMKLMAKAGLSQVEFGSDSLSDRVLESYGKRLRFDDIARSSHLAHEAGVDYCHFLICGGPGETTESLKESFELSRNLPSPVIMATVGMRIYPGTDLCRRAVAEGVIEPEADLLQPRYYVAPGLDSDEMFSMLKSFSAANPNWITGDTTPEYVRFVERLRKRGVAGPLWSYLPMIQRLWQPGLGPATGPSASKFPPSAN